MPVLLVSAAPALNARMMNPFCRLPHHDHHEASDKTDVRHEHADASKLKSVPEWFEQKRLKNYTKFQAQTARANLCSCPIENIKGAQNETSNKVKLSKNMWLQTSN